MHKTRRTLVLLLAAILGLVVLVSGCSSASTGSGSVAGVSTSVTHAPTQPSIDYHTRAFLAAVHRGTDLVPVYGTDKQVVRLGHTVCQALDRGATFSLLLNDALKSGLSPYDGGFVIGASVAAFCPQYKYLIPAN